MNHSLLLAALSYDAQISHWGEEDRGAPSLWLVLEDQKALHADTRQYATLQKMWWNVCVSHVFLQKLRLVHFARLFGLAQRCEQLQKQQRSVRQAAGNDTLRDQDCSWAHPNRYHYHVQYEEEDACHRRPPERCPNVVQVPALHRG